MADQTNAIKMMSDADLAALAEGKYDQMSDQGLMLLQGATASTAPKMEPPSMLARIGRGQADFYQGAKQKYLNWTDPHEAAKYTRDVNEEIGQYELGRMQNAPKDPKTGLPNPGFDMARLAGNVGTPLLLLPGGKEGAVKRAALGAVQGATGGYTNFSSTNSVDGNLMNTGIGLVAGGALSTVIPPIINKVIQGAQSARNWFSDVGGAARTVMSSASTPATIRNQINITLQQAGTPVDWSKLDQAAADQLIKEGQDQLSKLGKLDPEMLARKARMVAVGATPTRSMVTRNAVDWGMERNLSKLQGTGDVLNNIYDANDQAFRTLGQEIINGTGGTSKNATQTGASVYDAVRAIGKDSQKQVSALYQHVKDTKGHDFGMEPNQLLSTLDLVSDSAYMDSHVASVRNKLARYGVIGKDGTPTGQLLSVSQAEELRKFVNALPFTRETSSFTKDIIKAIDTDVFSTAGEDVFRSARAAAGQRKAALFNPWADRILNADPLTQGKIKAGLFDGMVLKGAPEDLASLKVTLFDDANITGGKAQFAAKSAWANLKQSTADWLYNQAVDTSKGGWSGAKFQKALDQIDEKLDIIFTPQEIGRLRLLAHASMDATYTPARAPVNNSNSATTMLSLMRQGGLMPSNASTVVTRMLENSANEQGLTRALSASAVDDTARKMSQAEFRNAILFGKNMKSPLGAMRIPGITDVPIGVIAGSSMQSDRRGQQ